MKTFFKKLFKFAFVTYAILFIIFFFDLDGKFLFYGVEPWLDKHYERLKRKDPLKMPYGMDKPDYEYKTE